LPSTHQGKIGSSDARPNPREEASATGLDGDDTAYLGTGMRERIKTCLSRNERLKKNRTIRLIDGPLVYHRDWSLRSTALFRAKKTKGKGKGEFGKGGLSALGGKKIKKKNPIFL